MKEEHFENDIQDKKPSPEKKASFPATVYLALALLVVVITTVGIFSISYDRDINVVSPSGVDISLPTVEFPSADPLPEFPVINDQSGVEDESEPERTLFYSPVAGDIIKKYSMDALVFSATMQDYRVHSGIDISAAEGAEVVAFTDGKVESVENDWFFGTTVAISHPLGVTSYYMCLADELPDNIKVGAEVAAGEVIGRVGRSRIESADPSHLHFELKVNGNCIDPAEELPVSAERK